MRIAQPETPEHFGGQFLDETMDLTGKPWLNCRFEFCTLKALGEPGSLDVRGSYFRDCVLIGPGWPEYLQEFVSHPGAGKAANFPSAKKS